MPTAKQKEMQSKKASLNNVWIPHEHQEVVKEAAAILTPEGRRPNKSAFIRDAVIREAYRVTGKPYQTTLAS